MTGPAAAWVKVVAVLVAVLTVVFAAALALISVTLLDGVAVSQKTGLSAALPAGGTVTIDSQDAGVRIVSGPAGRVSVDDEIDARTLTGALAEAALKAQPVARITSAPGGVTVSVPGSSAPAVGSFDRRVTVSVPGDSPLVVHAGAAAIDLTGAHGDVDITATAAAVRLTQATVDGTIRVSTASGAISVNGQMQGGALDLTAVTGAIAVTLPRGTGATYAAATRTGSVVVQEAGRAPRRSSGFNAALSGSLGDGSQGTIQLRTTAGAVVLETR